MLGDDGVGEIVDVWGLGAVSRHPARSLSIHRRSSRKNPFEPQMLIVLLQLGGTTFVASMRLLGEWVGSCSPGISLTFDRLVSLALLIMSILSLQYMTTYESGSSYYCDPEDQTQCDVSQGMQKAAVVLLFIAL